MSDIDTHAREFALDRALQFHRDNDRILGEISSNTDVLESASAFLAFLGQAPTSAPMFGTAAYPCQRGRVILGGAL